MKPTTPRSLSNPDIVPKGFCVHLVWDFIAVENAPALACRDELWETFEVILVEDGMTILGHTTPNPYKSGKERCADGEYHITQSVSCTLLVSADHSPEEALEKLRNGEAGLLLSDGKPKDSNQYWESLGFSVTLSK